MRKYNNIKLLIYIIMYICNITGNYFELEDNEKDRELGIRFGYNIRYRAISYVFTTLFYGECKILNEIEINKNIKGIGMSDCNIEEIFKEKFNYTNTFYHTTPYLDIYNNNHIQNYNNLDFIISSEIFQYINPYPSIEVAFKNLYKMLGNGGYLIFSVPFIYDKHKEYYPNLYNYTIKKKNNEYIIYNKTIQNKKEIFNNVRLEEGPGNTIEMRLFCKSSINYFLEKSGFIDITFYEITEDMNKYGIFWSKDNTNNCSLIISAKKSI
jgi:SAM-dependent methyltransferase